MEDGGVAKLNGWASLTVEGDDNLFAYNEAADSGGVFAGKDDCRITIEGGDFLNNWGEKVRAVCSRQSSCDVLFFPP